MALVLSPAAQRALSRNLRNLPQRLDLDSLRPIAAVAEWKALAAYRPGQGASEDTFIDLCVQRAITQAVHRELRETARFPRYEPHPLTEEEWTLESVADPRSLEEVETVDRDDELQTILSPVLAALPPRDREILRLRFWVGLTWDQMAERLGIARGAAWNAEQRALKRCRALLDGTAAPLVRQSRKAAS